MPKSANLPRPTQDVPPRQHDLLVACVLALFAFALRLPGLSWGLPDLYEEAMPLRIAWQMGGWSPDARFDLNPHFFHYPSLVLNLQLAVQALHFAVLNVIGRVETTLDYAVMYAFDRSSIYIAGRLLTVAFGAAGAAIMYFLARRVASRPVAALAALLLATNPLHLQESRAIAVDVPLACLVTWALLECLCLQEKPVTRRAALTGLALGLAASAKYTAGLAVVPLALALALAERKAHRLRLFAIAAGVALLAFAITSPYVLLDAKSAFVDLAEEREHMQVGHFGGARESSLGFVSASLAGETLGAPVALLSLAAMAVLGIARRSRPILILGAFAIVAFGVFSSWSMKAERYLLVLTPALLALAAAMLDHLLDAARLSSKHRWSAVAGIGIVAAALGLSVDTKNRAARADDTRTQSKQWIEAKIPTSAFILAEAWGPDIFDAVEFAGLDRGVRDRGHSLLEKRSLHGQLVLPMYQVFPERSAPYYDLALYPDVDFVLTTEAISSRYTGDRTRFSQQCAFYEALESKFVKVVEFDPSGIGGSKITLYKNPAHTQPLGIRKSLVGPRLLQDGSIMAPSQVSAFYSQWGINYEVFGHPQEALSCYETALRADSGSPFVVRDMVLGMARCRAALGDRNGAMATLDAGLAVAKTPEVQAAFRNYRQTLEGREEADDR